MTKIDRRVLLKGAGAAALATGLGAPALAQSGGRVVIGTWGGDYARLLNKNIDEPILKPKGIEIIQDQAGDAPQDPPAGERSDAGDRFSGFTADEPDFGKDDLVHVTDAPSLATNVNVTFPKVVFGGL